MRRLPIALLAVVLALCAGACGGGSYRIVGGTPSGDLTYYGQSAGTAGLPREALEDVGQQAYFGTQLSLIQSAGTRLGAMEVEPSAAGELKRRLDASGVLRFRGSWDNRGGGTGGSQWGYGAVIGGTRISANGYMMDPPGRRSAFDRAVSALTELGNGGHAFLDLAKVTVTNCHVGRRTWEHRSVYSVSIPEGRITASNGSMDWGGQSESGAAGQALQSEILDLYVKMAAAPGATFRDGAPFIRVDFTVEEHDFFAWVSAASAPDAESIDALTGRLAELVPERS